MMRPNLNLPLTYLITSGSADETTSRDSETFRLLVRLTRAAVDAGVSLIQIREKSLSARALLRLAASCAEVTRPSRTSLLINDRADIAIAAGAAGVHLTTQSIPTRAVRRTFGASFLIGVSTHSEDEVRAAIDGGADFVTFGPVFDTPSKRPYGRPVGVEALRRITREFAPFPVLALGGVNARNAHECISAGAGGIAGISLFSDPGRLADLVSSINP